MTRQPRARLALWPLLAYAAFVVYGSLVPLDFKPYPLQRAWADFQHIPFLHLGVESRADWVANGVLYLPLAYMAARWLAQALPNTIAGLGAWAGCIALAVGVEFAQLFFPPRTVSLNDVLAEGLGALLGVLLAPLFGTWMDRLRHAFSGGGRWFTLGLQAYALTYLALSLFPYDLLLSTQELQAKWQSGSVAMWVAHEGRGAFLVAVQWVVEALLTAPLAWLLPPRARRWGVGLLLGALLGLTLELAQLFIASGISQGASVASRALGLGLGAMLAARAAGSSAGSLRAALQRVPGVAWLAAGALYLLLLLAVNGVFRQPWQGPDAAAAVWRELRLLPFYYHYYTSEAVALFSLGSVVLMYLPLALLGWVRRWPRGAVLVTTVLLAAAVESTKLFLRGMHPDPTNVLIAVVAVAAALQLMQTLERLQRPGADAPAQQAPVAQATAFGAWLPALLLVAATVALFPLWRVPLALLLAACAVIVWRRPVLVFLLVPAALPVLDLAPWSGRLYWTEFDMLCALCLALALHRTAGLAPRPTPAWMRLGYALLALSLVASSLRALLPPPTIDANSFSSYYSAFNALRIVKGAVWAALLLHLWRRFGAEQRAPRWLGAGMALGLALTVLVMLWERAAFVGLGDLRADFRATGPFSAMHKGGAFIECWLAVAVAFTLAWALRLRHPAARLGAALLLAAAAYASMVTYSRNGYAALAVVVLGVLLAAWRAAPPARRRARPLLLGSAIVLLMVAAALPVALGPQSRQRLAASAADLQLRLAHWQDGLRMRDGALLTTLFGMGLGRYPETHYWQSQEAAHAATYALGEQDGRRFLRLGAGSPLYLEQIVLLPDAVQPTLTLALELRTPQGAPALAVALCRKWVLSSRECVQARAEAPAPERPGAWQRAVLRLDAGALLRAGNAGPALPLKLALLTPAQGSVDVGAVQLSSADGRALLVNGDFGAGMDRWFFATDVDPPWQLHSLPLTVLFEQGWFGVLAWALLFAAAFGIGARLVWRGHAQVPAALPALAGFAVSGTLNTLIDEPRFLCLLLLLLGLAARSLALPASAKAPPGVAA